MATSFYISKLSKNKQLDLREYYTTLQKDDLSKYINNKITQRCRICFRYGIIPINDNSFLETSETLQLFVDMNLVEYKKSLQHLCKMCYNFLEIAHLFKNIAKKSDDILRKYEIKNDIQSDSSDKDYNTFSDMEANIDQCSNDADDLNLESKKVIKKQKLSTKKTCEVCKKQIFKPYYKQHLTIHNSDHNNYICDICGKSFNLRSSYYNHSLRHGTDFPYKCQSCPYRAKYKELLAVHMRTHSGEYKYMCTECPARFFVKSNLNSHMLQHKPPQFQCDTCTRAFYTKIKLQRHFEVDHLGLKNHMCNICGKAFGYRNAMMKHSKNVHKREKMLGGRMPAYLKAENQKCESPT